MSARSLLARLPARRAPLWHAPLPHRGVIELAGRDARKLLQGLVTCDTTHLDAAPQYCGFLMPNGRVLCDAFLVAGSDGGVLLDVDRAEMSMLVQHLKRYKLRSKVSIRDLTDEVAVLAARRLDRVEVEAVEGVEERRDARVPLLRRVDNRGAARARLADLDELLHTGHVAVVVVAVLEAR